LWGPAAPQGGGGGGGGSGGNYVKLDQYVSVGGEADLTISNIDQTYDDLIVVVTGVPLPINVNMFMRLNGDAGNNYSYYRSNHYGAATSFHTNSMDLISSGGDATDGEVTISNYATTATSKILHAVSAFGTGNDNFPQIASGEWFSAAPVTEVSFIPQAGTFPAGAVLTVYGRGGTGSGGGGGGGGGGSGGSFEIAPTVPKVADFVLDNPGSGGSLATIADGSFGIVLNAPSDGSQIRFLHPTAPIPAAPYRAAARMQTATKVSNGSYQCCMIARGTNGKMIISGQYSNINVLVQHWSGYGNYDGNVYGVNQFDATTGHWHAIENDGINLNFQWSPDGETWFTYYSEPIANYLGAVDTIGCGVMLNGPPALQVLQSWKVA
jgi:hypothetical protein